MIGKLKRSFPTFEIKKDDTIEIISKVEDANYESGFYFECKTFKNEIAFIDIKDVIVESESDVAVISKNVDDSDYTIPDNEQDAFDKRKFWFGK
jgi:hypothetical protein